MDDAAKFPEYGLTDDTDTDIEQVIKDDYDNPDDNAGGARIAIAAAVIMYSFHKTYKKYNR